MRLIFSFTPDFRAHSEYYTDAISSKSWAVGSMISVGYVIKPQILSIYLWKVDRNKPQQNQQIKDRFLIIMQVLGRNLVIVIIITWCHVNHIVIKKQHYENSKRHYKADVEQNLSEFA